MLLLGLPWPWSGDTIWAAAEGSKSSTAAATAARGGARRRCPSPGAMGRDGRSAPELPGWWRPLEGGAG